MTNKIYYNALLDFYSPLLTEKQQAICDEYFRNDNTLQEIADEESISRAAVGDMIKRCKDELDEYESKLNLYASYKKRLQIYDRIKLFKNKDINVLIDECLEIEE